LSDGENGRKETKDIMTARRLPYSPEAERAVLGALILDSSKMNDIVSAVSADDFYIDRHKAIFSAMQGLFLESRVIDPVTLIDRLVKDGDYTEEGASAYIYQLAETVPAISNIKDYSKIVREKSLLRKLILSCEEIMESAYDQTEETQRIIDAAEAKIFALTQGSVTQDFSHIRDVIIEYMVNIHKISKDPLSTRGMPTYFSSLDAVLVGLGEGDLVLVGARPGMGKTSFAMNIASNMAKHGKTVAVFSLEMSKTQLVGRLLSSEGRIDSYKLRTGELTPDDFKRLSMSTTMLSATNIYIDDTSDVTVSQMKAKLRRIKNLSFVVIDYLQLMQADKRIDNRVLEIGDISRNLKIMAKELGIPIMLLSQLSRGPESRTDKKPQLSDLRDSGAIEQDADIVMFLYRDEYYKDNSDMKNQAECIIAKNRHGSTGKVALGWEGAYTRFCSIDDRLEGQE